MKQLCMRRCFFAVTLCCAAMNMYGQTTQNGIKTNEKKTLNKSEKKKSKFSDDPIELNNVVVTALGIKREEKSLGYATQTVSGSDITATMPTNWSQALQGQVAGLNAFQLVVHFRQPR